MGRPRRGRKCPGATTHQSEQRKEYCKRILGLLYTENRSTELLRLAEDVTNESCPLPVTTRGIGFIVSRVTSKLRQELPTKFNQVPVAAIYRISLIQLHLKMDEARNIYPFSGRDFHRSYPVVPNMPIENQRWFERIYRKSRHFPWAHNLSQIALVINSIGNVMFNNKWFHPVFSEERSPLNLRIDNLRAYCEEMANPETASSKRVAGFELNSIPNAKWARLNDDDVESVVLTNPDEVIPSDYLDCSVERINEDEHCVKKFIHSLIHHSTVSKFPELWGKIDYKCAGDPGLLVSTHVVPGQSLSLKDEVLSGNATEFWALEYIPPESWTLGVLALIGEVMDQTDDTGRSNIEGPRCFLNWRGVADVLL